MTPQGHLLGAKKLPAPGTPPPRSGPQGAFSRSGLGCVRAGVLISGEVIAEETVAGLGGPEHPCISEAGTREALLQLTLRHWLRPQRGAHCRRSARTSAWRRSRLCRCGNSDCAHEVHALEPRWAQSTLIACRTRWPA